MTGTGRGAWRDRHWEGTVTALEQHDWKPGEGKVLPLEPGPSHALMRRGWLPKPRHYEFGSDVAQCGAVVRVFLTVPFKAEDPDACPECVAAVQADQPKPRAPWADRWRVDPDREPRPMPDEVLAEEEQDLEARITAREAKVKAERAERRKRQEAAKKAKEAERGGSV